MEHVKIFEMPLPGYLGFPAFALECFTMYVFVRAVTVRVLGLQLTADRCGRHGIGTPEAGRRHGHTIAL